MPTIERVEQHAGVTVEQVIGDGAYGSGENRAACAAEHVDLLAPVMQPQDPTVDKSAFQIDLEQQTATCPQGHTVTGKPGPKSMGDPRCTSPSPGRPAKPARCSSAASRARSPGGRCPPIRTRRTCKTPGAAADRRVQGALPAAQRRRAQAGRTGATRLTRDPLPRPPQTPTTAPLEGGGRQPEAPVPAVRAAPPGLAHPAGRSSTVATAARNGLRRADEQRNVAGQLR